MAQRGYITAFACSGAIGIYLTNSGPELAYRELKDETFRLRLFEMSLGCFSVKRGREDVS